jgi:hypothetical protein
MRLQEMEDADPGVVLTEVRHRAWIHDIDIDAPGPHLAEVARNPVRAGTGPAEEVKDEEPRGCIVEPRGPIAAGRAAAGRSGGAPVAEGEGATAGAEGGVAGVADGAEASHDSVVALPLPLPLALALGGVLVHWSREWLPPQPERLCARP